MAVKNQPAPTELAVMKIIWLESPLSAGEIHKRIRQETGWSLSSTRKTLERMEQKNYLSSKQLHGVRVFSPKLKKVRTLASYILDFGRRVLELDGPLPVSMFIDSKLLDEKEIEELKAMLNKMER